MFTRSLTSIVLIPLCFSSVIWAQQFVDDKKAGSSHDAEEQAYALLLESCSATPNIDAQLMNEHGMLQAIQDRLLKELIRPELLSSPDEDWTAEGWISTARVYERTGQLRKSHDALSKALHLARENKGANFVRGMMLQRIATGLARHGDFEKAAEAATSIEIIGDDQFHITEAGPVQVAADAHRSYVLLVLTSMQTRIARKASAAVRYDGVAELVESIPNETVRSAALWVMALRQAENGDTEAAVQTIQAVNEQDIDRLTSKVGPIITEFTTRGPNPVPWPVYRVVSLEQVALHLSLKGDDAAAAGLVDQVTDVWLKDNVQLEVACGLLQKGRFESTTRWVDRIESLDVRSRADGIIVLSLIRAGELDRAEKSISQVADVARRSELRLQLIDKLLDRDDRIAAEGHLQIVRNDIGGAHSADAGLLYSLGSVEARAGNHEKAVMALLAAGKASDAIEPYTDRIIALAPHRGIVGKCRGPERVG